MIVMKIALKNRSEETRICEIQALTELKTNLEMIIRNFPNKPISDYINETNLILKLTLELNSY